MHGNLISVTRTTSEKNRTIIIAGTRPVRDARRCGRPESRPAGALHRLEAKRVIGDGHPDLRAGVHGAVQQQPR